MRFKDIEKRLRSEHDESRVPDVYMRVKKAPINKLLEGETPALAFQKQIAMKLLIGTAIIFIVAAIAVAALWFSKPTDLDLPDYYVSVTVERQTGRTESYGAVLREDSGTVLITEEYRSADMSDKHDFTECLQITDFILFKSDDKVSISIFGDARNHRTAFLIASDMAVRLKEDCGAEAVISVNDAKAKADWATYILQCGGKATAEDGFWKLIAAYLNLFE